MASYKSEVFRRNKLQPSCLPISGIFIETPFQLSSCSLLCLSLPIDLSVILTMGVIIAPCKVSPCAEWRLNILALCFIYSSIKKNSILKHGRRYYWFLRTILSLRWHALKKECEWRPEQVKGMLPPATDSHYSKRQDARSSSFVSHWSSCTRVLWIWSCGLLNWPSALDGGILVESDNIDDNHLLKQLLNRRETMPGPFLRLRNLLL